MSLWMAQYGTVIDQLADLREIAEQLEPHARIALLRIARRFLVGQKQYGKLDVANDIQRRKFVEEAAQEASDQAAYLEFWLMQEEIKRAVP